MDDHAAVIIIFIASKMTFIFALSFLYIDLALELADNRPNISGGKGQQA